MFGGVLNSLTRKLGQTATKSEAGKLASLVGGEGAIAKATPKAVPAEVADQIIYHGTPNKFTKFNNDGGSTWFTNRNDKLKDTGLSWNGQGELNVMERKLPSDLKLATRDLEDRYTRWELENLGYGGIKYDDIGDGEVFYEIFNPNKLPLNESVPEEALAYLGGNAGSNDLAKYIGDSSGFVAKKNLGAKPMSERYVKPVDTKYLTERLKGKPVEDVTHELERLLDKSISKKKGWSVRSDESRVSQSQYLMVDDQNGEQLLKVRISDHDLPAVNYGSAKGDSDIFLGVKNGLDSDGVSLIISELDAIGADGTDVFRQLYNSGAGGRQKGINAHQKRLATLEQKHQQAMRRATSYISDRFPDYATFNQYLKSDKYRNKWADDNTIAGDIHTLMFANNVSHGNKHGAAKQALYNKVIAGDESIYVRRQV